MGDRVPNGTSAGGHEQHGQIEVKATAKGTSSKKATDGALALEAALPYARGKEAGAIVAVEIINNSTRYVDQIGTQIGGAATIFQARCAVSTSVRDSAGARAIGSVMSDQVQNAALKKNTGFRGDAFVVNKDMYTAYEPIHDPTGKAIGMLFVGVAQGPLCGRHDRL